MNDPLRLLRDYWINNKEIVEKDDQVVFGDFSWPKTVKTNYRMYDSSLNGTERKYYTLEGLLNFIKNANLSHTTYVRKTAILQIPIVSRPDRKDLLAYLQGEINTSASIDLTVPIEQPTVVIKRQATDDLHHSAKRICLDPQAAETFKEKLETRFDAPKKPLLASIETVKSSLTDQMSREEIAAIKAKRLTKKRTKVNVDDNFERITMQKTKSNVAIFNTNTVLNYERESRTRTTILQSNSTKLGLNVLEILSKVEKLIEEESKNNAVKPYNRYDQQRYNNKVKVTENFKIDTQKSFRDMTMKSVTDNLVVPVPHMTASKLVTKRNSRIPIIIVPCAGQTLISMINVIDILQKMKFVTIQQKRSEGAVNGKETLIIRKKANNETVAYKVIDMPNRLHAEDWNRVVALFVLGPNWQFKGFPWSTPVDTLANICGFHLKYDDVPLDPKIEKLDVHVLQVSRKNRYLDFASLKTFWEKLDHFLSGHPQLVNMLAKMYSKLINREIDAHSEVLVTCGAYEALYSAIHGHVDENDEVIIIEPFFDCYEPMVRSAGGIPKFIALKPESEIGNSENWKLNENELEEAFNERTKMIILNTPNNPLGKVFKKHELEKIADLCRKWNVLCVSDEVYEWLIYKPKEHLRIATLPEMWERTITIGSAGKTFSVTGWKTGWAYGHSKLMENLFMVHQNCIYTCCTPIQKTIAHSFETEMNRLGSDKCYFVELPKMLETKRDFMAAFLRDCGGFEPVIPEGGYFMIADWSATKAKKASGYENETDRYEDYKFTKWMTKNLKLQAIPLSAFYSEPHKHLAERFVRFCFIKKDENLQKAAEILQEWK